MRLSLDQGGTSRDLRLKQFLNDLSLAIKFQKENSPEIVRVAEKILQKTKRIGLSGRQLPRFDLPALRFFKESIAIAEGNSPPISNLSRSIAALSEQVSWYQSTKSRSLKFLNGHANTQILGPLGLENRDDVVIGISLLSPNIEYPVHKHAPEEIYLVLSSGDWFQESRGWFSPGDGKLVYTPPNISHSMRSNEKPLLTVWCLNGSKF